MPPEFSFRPGQYLEVLHADGGIPMSIASAPWRLPELHLHYRSTPGMIEATRMDELLSSAPTLRIAGPAGDVSLPDVPSCPILLVAGGTGVSQALSFIDHWNRLPPRTRVTLLWCVDEEADWYLGSRLTDASWLETVCIADANRSSENRGLAWLRRHGNEFAGVGQVVLCGGPAFVHAASDALAAAGVAPEQMRSDVFSYAPRTPRG